MVDLLIINLLKGEIVLGVHGEPAASGVLNDPLILRNGDVHDAGRHARLGLDVDFLLGNDVELVELVALGLVDRVGVPEAHEAVGARGHDAVFEAEDHLDAAFVAGLRRVDAQQTLDEHAFPEQQRAVLRGGDHLAVGVRVEGRDVGQLLLAELGDVALELEPREGLRDLPEPD